MRSEQTELAITYGGIEIEYREAENRWRFELHGRERFAESLSKAKEAIDKPEPRAKTHFQRISAYRIGARYEGNDFSVVEITSLAEESMWSGQQVWVTFGDKKREKLALSKLAAITPENDALIAEIRALEKQSEELDAAISKKRESLTRPVVEAE